MSVHMSGAYLMSAHGVSAVLQPIQALPAGLAESLTGAVGVAILTCGAVIDVLALKGGKSGGKGGEKGGGEGISGLNQQRMALVVLIYFSGWLTLLEACHARDWWGGMITDPGVMFLVRLVGLGLLTFLSLAVIGLVMKKAPVQVTAEATKRVTEHQSANKAKITPTALAWAAVTALGTMAIPMGTAASNYAMYVLNAPGTVVSATLIRGAAHLVGSDGQTPAPARDSGPGQAGLVGTRTGGGR